MGFFEYKKWFFDTVSDEGDDYLIMLVSQVKLGRKYRTYFQMHGARKGQDCTFRPYLKCIRTFRQKDYGSTGFIFEEGEINFENGGCRINLEMGSYKVKLVYECNRIDWPLGFNHFNYPRKTYIDWIPRILYGQVSGTVDAPPGVKVYEKEPGYCDEVFSNVSPWKVTISQLYWGRLHYKNINLSYSIMKDRKTFSDISRLFVEVNGTHYVLDTLFFNIIERKRSKNMNLTYAEKYLIRGKSDELEIKIEVGNHEEMILNDFMDYINEYGTILTSVLRRISRDPLGIKFRASANISIRINDERFILENVALVDEFVKFCK